MSTGLGQPGQTGRMLDALRRARCGIVLWWGMAILWLCIQETTVTAEDLKIDADYPGGNILVEKTNGDTVYLRQDLRDTAGWWFYWSFRVRGAAGRTLTFRFVDRNPVGVRGPAVSTDGGAHWEWLGAKSVKIVDDDPTFSYRFPDDAGEVRFCFAMPYQEADLDRFLKQHEGSRHLAVKTLCTTRKGRTVRRLHAGRLDGEPAHRVLLTCRHHACEMMASYSLEALVGEVLADTDDGRWFREHVEILAVPFVDKDGVEDGDQGKNRKPRDHNRDYIGESIYASTRALRQLVPEWSGGRLHVALDLHCPWIRGTHNEAIYIVGSELKEIWSQQREFARILEKVQTGALPYRAMDNLPFGQGWNTSGNYESGKSCARWAAELKGIWLAGSFEIPYANARGKPVTADSARSFGRDLARALRRYLDEHETP